MELTPAVVRPAMERTKSCVVKKVRDVDAGERGASSGSATPPTRDGFRNVVLALTRSSSFVLPRQTSRADVGFSSKDASNGSATEIGGNSESPGEGSSRMKGKFKMKDETKLMLKIHIIRDKAVAIDGMLRDLKVSNHIFEIVFL